MAKEKKPISTLKKRNRLKFAHRATAISKWIIPTVPVIVEGAISWQNWFSSPSKGIFTGTGFVFAILSVLLSYFSLAKKKKIFEKYSAFWSVALVVVCWGIAFIFLSLVINELGMVLLYVGLSLMASATVEEIDRKFIQPRYQEYNELVSKYKLDTKAEIKKAKEEERRQRAEEAARIESERRAID